MYLVTKREDSKHDLNKLKIVKSKKQNFNMASVEEVSKFIKSIVKFI